MKGIALAVVLVLVVASAPALAQPPSRQLGESAAPGTGSVEKVQLTALTRDRAQAWIRTVLPRAAKGWRQTFTGEITAANVPLPIHPPVTVAVQEAGGRAEAVFSIDIRLDELPPQLLDKAGTQTLDLVVQGTLSGEGKTQAPVHAVGLLRYGTAEIESPRGSVADFARLGSAQLTGITFSETSGEARLLLFNPFSFPIPIKSVTYTLTAGDRRLCGGEKTAQRIHPRRETEIVLPIDARNSDLIAAAGSAILAGGTIDGRLTGAIVLRVGRGDVTIPIAIAAPIELVR